MKRIPYSTLFGHAFLLTKKNPFLWWYGTIIALVGISQDIYFNSYSNILLSANSTKNIAELFIFTQESAFFSFGLLSILFIIFGSIYLLSILSLASIWTFSLKSQQCSIPGKFFLGFQQNKKFLWPIFLLRFLLGITLLFLLGLLLLPAFLIWLHDSNNSLFFIITFLAFSIYIPLFITIFIVRKYAQIYIVLARLSVLDALDAACALLRKNILPSILMSLYLIGWNIFLVLLLFIGTIFFTLLGLITGIIFYIFNSAFGMTLLIYMLLTLLILFGLFIKSFFIIFIEISWIKFFTYIASQKKEKPLLKQKVPSYKTLPHQVENIPVSQ